MKSKEFITELKKIKTPKTGDITPHDYNPGWEKLNSLKKEAVNHGKKMSDTYQLFVPRGIRIPSTKEKSMTMLRNKYAWDDEGNLTPQYTKWDKGQQDLNPAGKEPINEAAPILKGRATPPPGHNKPQAHLWTSTGYKKRDGWYSDWVRWSDANQPEWVANTGYLYKVKPGALILELDTDHDAEDIIQAFIDLKRVEVGDDYYQDPRWKMRTVFPWNEIAKHFDAVHHSGTWGHSEFMYGWDVESTAWLNTDFLQLIGEVPVAIWNDDED
jgi:hypothetical protein